MSNEKKSKRLQIDLTPESHERLQYLKQNTECTSFAEVTGRAYTLFELSVKAKKEGKELIIRDPATGKEQIVLV